MNFFYNGIEAAIDNRKYKNNIYCYSINEEKLYKYIEQN